VSNDTVLLSDDDLMERFEAATLPAAMFHHRQHVRVAWLYVRRHGMPEALGAFSQALRRFATANGAHNLFHVTITWAYVLLVNERQQMSEDADWDTFAATNPDLLTWKPSILDDYYTHDTLWSERARRTFVMPDRVLPPLRATPVPAGDTAAGSSRQADV
jgi:hypothetical protein